MQSFHPHKGVTIIELLVVLAIITILSIIVITGHSAFRKTFLLSNAAYDLALTIRSAETFGLGNTRSVAGMPVAQNTGYGIHLQASSPDQFILFADLADASSPTTNPSNCHPSREASPNAPDAIPGNCAYTPNELITTYQLGNGVTIHDFCGYHTTGYSAGIADCFRASGVANGYTHRPQASTFFLNMVFARPNTKTYMSVNGIYEAGSPVTKACITLASQSKDAFRYILVEQTGAITVNADPCP